MDQYVSWSLSSEELMFDTIWENLRVLPLATSQLMNGTMHYRPHVALAKYPPETAKMLHRDIFWFFLKDEDFVSKTINDSNIDLYKFPASKVRQLSKKVKSSKATTRHIKQMASDPRWLRLTL